MKMAVISAVLTEVVTKQDVRDLRQEMNQLRTEINDLRREMRSLIRWAVTTILAVWGSTIVLWCF